MDLLVIANIIFLVGNLIAVSYGIAMSQKNYNITVTSSYIERYNSLDMMESKIIIEKYFLDLEKEKEKSEKEIEIRKLLSSSNLEDIKIVFHIKNICNLFTELGVAFRGKHISRKVLFTFGPLIPRYWEKLEIFILIDRRINKEKGGTGKIYTSFEYLKNYLEEDPFWSNNKLKL